MRGERANTWCQTGAIVILAGLAAVACDDEDEPAVDEPLVADVSVCDPASGSFTADVDNRFFPLPVGQRRVLEGTDDDGATLRVETTVLDETMTVAGVATRVVQSSELEDGELVETVRDFYAQAADGTVCYFGEDVDIIEAGLVVGHEGAWRAGDGGAAPGIIMPGSPEPGLQFPQERAPGVAEDMSAVAVPGLSIDVPAGTFEGALLLVDWNPLEGETIVDAEHKVYAPGVGLIVDDVAKLVSVSP